MMRINKLNDWAKNQPKVNIFKRLQPDIHEPNYPDRRFWITEHIDFRPAHYWEEFHRSKHGELQPEKPVDTVEPKKVQPKMAVKPVQFEQPKQHEIFDTKTPEQKMAANPPMAAKRQKPKELK